MCRAKSPNVNFPCRNDQSTLSGGNAAHNPHGPLMHLAEVVEKYAKVPNLHVLALSDSSAKITRSSGHWSRISAKLRWYRPVVKLVEHFL